MNIYVKPSRLYTLQSRPRRMFLMSYLTTIMRSNYTIIYLLFAVIMLACNTKKDSDALFSISDRLTDKKLAEFELKVSENIREYTNSKLDSTHISLGTDHVFVSDKLTKLYNEVKNRRLWSEEKNRNDLRRIF